MRGPALHAYDNDRRGSGTLDLYSQTLTLGNRSNERSSYRATTVREWLGLPSVCRIKLMHVRKFYCWTALYASVALGCFGSDSAMDRATLRGLQAVKVIIDPPSPELEHDGVDRELLRVGVVQKLQNAGIKIDNEAVEFLGVDISSGARAGRKGPTPVVVGVGVYQVVAIARDKTTKTVAETWGDQRVMALPSKGLDREVSNTVDDLVDQFVRAYRSVNPQ
jgi:hypothetical protein